ncbi:helix-turn-helix domain-containing protein [Flagellimonas meridianipacifica]|uniref:AraC-like DNA-binding protein n=1 Tax=Flagellimonas meridianipacifica TaxID=1080225 RepID=A0A2T0MCA0_9FLAO|nr:AraC family transcriptional regulator [Allomuricauda pacifica]PRX55131.1 AraC-like DNA-binding protein [Allomuricauda pacifica]
MLNLATGEYFGKSTKTVENEYLKLCITNYGPETIIAAHNHENPYLSLLVNGSYLEEGEVITQTIAPGEVLYRPKGYGHRNCFEQNDGTCFNIEFKPDWFNHLINPPLNRKDKPIKFSAAKYPFFYKLFLQLKKHPSDNIIFNEVYDFYSNLITPLPKRDVLPWVKNVGEIVQEELHKFHSLDELSNKVYVHPVYLSRAFKLYSGYTLKEFQMKVKIERAIHLLLNTPKNVSSISFELGFYDDSHFIRAFKSIYGISPAKFKRNLRT